jgi:hypothetical protein
MRLLKDDESLYEYRTVFLGRTAAEIASIFATSTLTARSTGVGCHWIGQ